MDFSGFKQYFEKADYYDGLADELGIEPEQRDAAFKAEPWVTSQFSLGGINYKTAAWEIVKNYPDGSATIKLKNLPGQRAYMGKTRYEGPPDEKEYRLSRKQMIQLLTVGWTPALQAQVGAGGDAGGGIPDPTAVPGAM